MLFMTIPNVARMFDQASTALSHRSILAYGREKECGTASFLLSPYSLNLNSVLERWLVSSVGELVEPSRRERFPNSILTRALKRIHVLLFFKFKSQSIFYSCSCRNQIQFEFDQINLKGLILSPCILPGKLPTN